MLLFVICFYLRDIFLYNSYFKLKIKRGNNELNIYEDLLKFDINLQKNTLIFCECLQLKNKWLDFLKEDLINLQLFYQTGLTL